VRPAKGASKGRTSGQLFSAASRARLPPRPPLWSPRCGLFRAPARGSRACDGAEHWTCFALSGASSSLSGQVGEQLGFASNKLGTTASSNATRRRVGSCVSRYFGGCRFGFVGRGADEHSQGEVGGAGSRNGTTRTAKPSDDGRSVRFCLGFCTYRLACAGTCVLVHSRRSGAGAHVLCGPLWRCGSSRKLPLRFGSSTRRSGAGDAFRGFVGV